jgi:hypothetical protein
MQPPRWLARFSTKLCEFQEEIHILKHKNIPSDNTSYTQIERNLTESNLESMEDAEQF